MDDNLDVGMGTAFKIVKGIVKDFFYDIVCYAIGWFVLRIVTVGKYPEETLMEGIQDPESSESIPNIIGFIIITAISYYLFS